MAEILTLLVDIMLGGLAYRQARINRVAIVAIQLAHETLAREVAKLRLHVNAIAELV